MFGHPLPFLTGSWGKIRANIFFTCGQGFRILSMNGTTIIRLPRAGTANLLCDTAKPLAEPRKHFYSSSELRHQVLRFALMKKDILTRRLPFHSSWRQGALTE